MWGRSRETHVSDEFPKLSCTRENLFLRRCCVALGAHRIDPELQQVPAWSDRARGEKSGGVSSELKP